MFVGMRYRLWGSSSKIERFLCKQCSFTSKIQFVGEGTGVGLSPFFLDNDGAQQRARDSAQRSADKDLARLQRLISCYQCGYRDPSAFKQERAKSVAILVGGAALSSVALLATKSWSFFVIGAAATLICGILWRSKSRPKGNVIFLDDKSCALPRRSAH